MFYRIALSESHPYNVATSTDGDWFYIPGECQPFHRDELSEVIDLPIPLVLYQDGTHATIGDNVKSICGEYEGTVTELHHPRGIFTSGRVKLDSGRTVTASGFYKL